MGKAEEFNPVPCKSWAGPDYIFLDSPLELLHCVLGFLLFRCTENTDAAKKNREVLVILKISRLYYTRGWKWMANENRPRAGFFCHWNLSESCCWFPWEARLFISWDPWSVLLKIERYLCLQTGNLQLELECWTVGKKGTMRRARNMGFTITQL